MAADGTFFNRRLSAIYPPAWPTLTPPITHDPLLGKEVIQSSISFLHTGIYRNRSLVEVCIFHANRAPLALLHMMFQGILA